MNKKNIIIGFMVLFVISYFYNKSHGRDIIAEIKQAAVEGWEEGYNGEISSAPDNIQQSSEAETSKPLEDKRMSDEEYMSRPITARITLDEYIRRNNVPVVNFSNRAKFDEIFQNALTSMNNYGIPIYTSGMSDQEAVTRYETAFTDTDKKGLPICSSGNKYKVGSQKNWQNCDYIFYGNAKSREGGEKLTGEGIIFHQTNIGSYSFMRIVYMGELKDGYYSGYGQAYYAPDDYSTYDRYILDSYGDRLQEGVYEAMNYLEYEGKFKKGKYNGRGNRYEYLDSESRYMVMLAQQPDFKPENYGIAKADFDIKFNEILKLTREVAVYTGTFSYGEDKNTKLYVYGQETDPKDYLKE